MRIALFVALLISFAMCTLPAAAHGNTVAQKLRGLQVPGPARAVVIYTWPEGSERGNSSGAAANGTIYDPDRILGREALAHETFHLLDDQHMTDADRGRVMPLLGEHVKQGAWVHGEPGQHVYRSSAQEVAADWYAAIVTKRDPNHGWGGAYADGGIPTRKELLRFGRALERMGQRYGLKPYAQPRPAVA